MNKLWFDQSLSDVQDQDDYIEKKKKFQLDNKIVESLRALGHEVKEGKEAEFAVVQAVYRKAEGIDAKSEPRKFGAPTGQ